MVKSDSDNNTYCTGNINPFNIVVQAPNSRFIRNNIRFAVFICWSISDDAAHPRYITALGVAAVKL